MTDPDQPDAEELPQSTSDTVDSVMRAVARASTVDLPVAAPVHSGSAEELLEEPPPMPKVGDVLGDRYRLESILGAGGMGAVFAARNIRTDKEVAIKVLLPHQGGKRFKGERVTRFVREAKAAGRIRHPNVVDVYDVEGDTATPYLVMERLYGESLWQRMKRKPLGVRETVEILRASMRGVAEAHRQGVIHRDLKPDNIFLAVTPNEKTPTPKVLDFGVSRIISRTDSDERRPTTITRTGYVLGTPSYMPLEQLRGDPNVDARADVYALGVILYEALTGVRPFEAQNDHELVIRMVTERPTPLTTRAQHLDPVLESIVMRALAKEPLARFPDVESFAAALEAWAAGDHVQAMQPIEPVPVAAATAPTLDATPSEVAVMQVPTPLAVPVKRGPSNTLITLSLVAVVAVLTATLSWRVLKSSDAPKEPAQTAQVATPRAQAPAAELTPAPVSTPPAVVAPVEGQAPAQTATGVAPAGKRLGHKKTAHEPDRATKLLPEDF